jgi:4-hydroxy-tetrahydrodipicolinate synthase
VERIVTHLAPGVWGVVATPFAGSTLDVDEASLVKLVSHYASIGVTGLTVLGVFGEAAQLSSSERHDVLQAVAGSVELPLVVGATSLGTAPVIEEGLLAAEAVGSRIAGLMVQVNSPQRDVLTAHLRAVHEATDLPIVVQDYPAISGVSIPAEVLATALADLPFVAAVKAEAPPTPPAIAMLTARLDVPVFGGLGGIGLLDELAAGSAGAMTGFSFPEGLLACVSAFRSGGYEAAREAFLPYLPLVNFEQQVRIALAVRKEALRRRGLIAGSAARPPAASFPATLSEQLDRHLTAVPALEGVR